MVVLNTSIRRALRPAILTATGAAVVEIFYTFVAITLNQWLGHRLVDNVYLDVAALIILLGLGLYFWFSPPRAQKKSQSTRRSWGYLGKGLFFGLINPQSLPFITLGLMYTQSQNWVYLQGIGNCLGLMVGVATGRFLSLLLYAHAGQWLSSQLQHFSQWANKVTGGILLLLGGYQAIQVGMELYRGDEGMGISSWVLSF